MPQCPRSNVAATVILVLATFAPRALGWGGDGHQIVALIAEDHLTPAAKAGIRDLLDGANISDAEVANWADEIRRQRRATAPWHYVNIPTSQPTYDPARDGNNGDNVIDAIGRFERVLSDKAAPKADRAEALKFLVHFVGDIHQPLHCADRNGDKGGNAQLVFFGERTKAVNLHSCWDSLILLKRKGKTPVLDYATALDRRMDPKAVAMLSAGTPPDWANEGVNIAVESAYADVPADGPPEKLSEKYVEAAGQVIDRQLAKAGVRLAMVLNRAVK